MLVGKCTSGETFRWYRMTPRVFPTSLQCYIMAQYPVAEMVDMVFCYGACQQNLHATVTAYAGRYPDRRHPSIRTLSKIMLRFRETGTVNQRQRTGRPRDATDDETSTFTLAAVSVNPHTSSRALAQELGVGKTSILRILHRHRFHPYHVHCHQGLKDTDYVRRTRFCEWLQTRVGDNPLFPTQILWTDEASFSRDGVVNRHNLHYWADVNPHWLREVSHQEQWRTNVWCGIYKDRLIGPIFYDGTLDGIRFRDMILQGIVTDLIDDLPLAEYSTMWMQLDGAPAHFRLTVREWLNAAFPGRWIGRGGPAAWPPRSPDITPLDFFLWGHLKQVVYATPTTTKEDLQARIRDACEAITPELLATVRRSLMERIQRCIGVEGRHFEHFLD